LRLRLLVEWIAVTVMTCAIIALLFLGEVTQRLDNVVYDSLVGLAAPSPSDRILLVTIDDASIATLGRWPWPRDVHAQFLQRLSKTHVSAVAYDVLFTETADAAQDKRLGDAIRLTGSVALPVLFETPGSNGRPIDVTLPVSELTNATAHVGQVALFPDPEGMARSVPLSLTLEKREWLHLTEVAYRIAEGHPSPVYQRLAARHDFLVTIPFRARSGDFRTVSFHDVLAGQVPTGFLKDRIVLVGVTASGLGDRFRVPSRFGGLLSGIELQANVMNSLLSNRVVFIPNRALGLALSVFPALILLLSFWWLRPRRALAASLVAIAVVLFVPALLLISWATWIAPTSALIGLLVAYPLWGWRRLEAVDRQIADELDAFAAEDTPLPLPEAIYRYLDPIGGQAARLRLAIANMRDLRRLVRDTIDSVDDPILVTNGIDRPILANAAARTVFGPNFAEHESSTLMEKFHREPTVYEDGMQELHVHGDDIYSLRRYPLRDHMGKDRGLIMQLVNVTAIRAAQRTRQETLEFLSHDMRAPQSSIITLVERYRESITDSALAERITGLARKTLRLADNFVQLARLSAVPFDPEEVDIVGILSEAIDEVWALAVRGAVHIVIENPEEVVFIRGERDTLARAFSNLLDNAIKFSPEGSRIRCRIVESPTAIECTIEDEGPGIPAERRGNLFAKFGYQTKLADAQTSSGLGLAFVGAAIKRHSGMITCEECLPTGTRFMIYFPPVT